MCACQRKDQGFFRVNARMSPASGTNRKSRVKARMEDSMSMDESYAKDSKIVESINADIEEVFNAHKSLFHKELCKQVSSHLCFFRAIHG